jgi:ribosomal protein S25
MSICRIRKKGEAHVEMTKEEQEEAKTSVKKCVLQVGKEVRRKKWISDSNLTQTAQLNSSFKKKDPQ